MPLFQIDHFLHLGMSEAQCQCRWHLLFAVTTSQVLVVERQRLAECFQLVELQSCHYLTYRSPNHDLFFLLLPPRGHVGCCARPSPNSRQEVPQFSVS